MLSHALEKKLYLRDEFISSSALIDFLFYLVLSVFSFFIRWTLPFLDEAKKKKIEEILNKSDSSEIAVSYNEYNWHLNSVE